MKNSNQIVRYSQLVMPQDTNVIGTLFGGQMISWMDIAVSKAAHRVLKYSVADSAVTRAIDATEFKEPVMVGEWVNFEAKLIGIGRSSLKILVEAYAEGKADEGRLACISTFTMVAVRKKENGTYGSVPHGVVIED
tara:strand:+ start:369 stop:776 length:408 start_codon:yes stop_codon:yes gene_type:complete